MSVTWFKKSILREMFITCPECKTKNRNTDISCSHCGFKFIEEDTSTEVNYVPKDSSIGVKVIVIIIEIIIVLGVLYRLIIPENSVNGAIEIIKKHPYKIFEDSGMTLTDVQCQSLNNYYKCNFSVYSDTFHRWVRYDYKVEIDTFKWSYKEV